MASERGATLAARTLEALGVRHVFGLCGDHVNPVFDALADTSVRLVGFRDERGAGFAAEGWALATGEPGVACVTAGPGLANAVGPLADCHAWGVPVVVLAGRAPLREADRGSPGEMPQLEVVRPIAKWARTVLDPDRVPEYLVRAFSEATAGRPGPAVVELPLDVQNRPAEARPPPAPPPRPRPAPSPAAVAAAAEVLGRAERPLVVGGSGLWWSGAGAWLGRFAERHGVPVLLKGAARGLLPDHHDLCFGLPNPWLGEAAVALGEADAFLVVGTRLDLHLAHGAILAGRPAVQVDVDPAALGPQASVAVVADAAEALRALAQTDPPPAPLARARARWVGALQEARRAAGKLAEERTGALAPGGVHPARLVGELRRLASPGTTVVVDAGELALWGLELLPAPAPASLVVGINSPLGGLGPGVPFGIAAALARPERRTVVLAGDGALGFCAIELHTASRLGLPLEVVVGNDGAWGIIAHVQERLYGRRTATDIGPLRYDDLGRALGCEGARVDRPEELPGALARPPLGRPRVVDVRLDPDVVHPLCGAIASMFGEA